MKIDIRQIKQISIRDYLAQRGIRPTNRNPHYGLYLSPLRKESIPSFKVDYTQNLWYDFGLGEGGSIIDLVMRLEPCDFAQAVRVLHDNERTTIAAPVSLPVVSTTPSLRILSETSMCHPVLLDYVRQRGIIVNIARTYCREVRYTTKGRTYFAIGFQNDAGGWELRSAYFKGCVSPKQITTQDNHAKTVVVFEGFMDFLSYLSLKYPEQLHADAVVLNSVVNLPRALSFLRQHTVIHAFFDNDEAGRRTLTELMRLCPHCEVIDHSYLYRSHKDLNEYLQTRQRKSAATTKEMTVRV